MMIITCTDCTLQCNHWQLSCSHPLVTRGRQLKQKIQVDIFQSASRQQKRASPAAGSHRADARMRLAAGRYQVRSFMRKQEKVSQSVSQSDSQSVERGPKMGCNLLDGSLLGSCQGAALLINLECRRRREGRYASCRGGQEAAEILCPSSEFVRLFFKSEMRKKLAEQHRKAAYEALHGQPPPTANDSGATAAAAQRRHRDGRAD